MKSRLILDRWRRLFCRCLNGRSLRSIAQQLMLLLCVCFIFDGYLVASKKSYDDIFKQVFGRLPQKQYFPQQMALIIDHQYVGEDITVMVPSIGTDYKLSAYPILKHLYAVQKQGTMQDLVPLVDKDGMIESDKFSNYGYTLSIDRRGFRVYLEIPAEYRQKIMYYILGEPEEIFEKKNSQLVRPANLSGYLNYSFSTNYISSDLEDDDTGFQAPMGSFVGQLKSNQYSLHYAGAFDLQSDELMNMANLNFQEDSGIDNKRLTVGQVTPLTKGTQTGMSLMGVSYTEGPTLDPIGNFSPQFSHDIELDVDSQVDIYINYSLVKSLQLPGGFYELKGFPLRTGFNVIKIVKTSYYDPEPPEKKSFVNDGQYNDISQGVLYTTNQNPDESLLEQSFRLHQSRQQSSEWLVSDKIPRKGVEITEDAPTPPKKVVTEYVYPFAVDPILYDPKYLEFNYGVGYPMSWSGFTPSVSGDLIQSFYIKKGLNKLITSTFYTQLKSNQTLVGTESYISTPFGPLSLDQSLSYTDELDKLGASARFGFITYPLYWNPNAWFKLVNVGFSASIRGSSFIPFGASRLEPYENSTVQYSSSISYQLFNLLSGTLQFSRLEAVSGDNSSDQDQFSTAVQYRLPFGFGLSATYQNNIGEEVIEPQIFSFKVSWSGLGGVGLSSTYKETVSTRDVQYDTSVQSMLLDGRLNTSTSYHHEDEKQIFSTSLRYGKHNAAYTYANYPIQTDHQFGYVHTNQRFNSNILMLFREIEGIPFSSYTLSAESAFVYADNVFAISQPVQDGFAIFSRDDSLSGKTVYVGQEGSKIDGFGPAVLPALADRIVTDVIVDIPELSVGAKYNRLFSFKPINGQGYLIEMHVTPSVLLMGKLLNEQQKPIKYFRGYIHPTADLSNKTRFITSRSGIFQAANLEPGEYVLTFGKKPYSPKTLTIPSNADGLYKIPPIEIQKLDSVPVTGESMSELETQLKEVRSVKPVDETVSLVSTEDLLQELITDILAEPSTKEEVVTDSIQVDDKVVLEVMRSSPVIYSDASLSTLEKGQSLHELKSDINDFVLQLENAPTVKDSLAIAQKINNYYLNQLPTKNNSLQVSEGRSTSERALMKHQQNQTKPITKKRIQSNVTIDTD